ncbi:hypothetical protein MUN82_03825 [Hymenobacter aerilatus]|uniref:Uncharacterized protein n=1 Tax=Hymenobacter aerilatus TaxID=2932251 RepID=A0A8T9SWW4_9BACT|nr:hypothetical protein [Hymenobacter aerilatus]UOR06227.1 hypothetical protein MUN82_03825 [Hymenobacter aerilatus]
MPKAVEMWLWLEFLKAQGLVYIRTHASHDIYDRPDNSLLRNITVRPNKDDEVPMTHMKTSLQTLGLQMKDFTEWQKQRGKGNKKKKVVQPEKKATDSE